jgi:hypothetical protein
LYKWYESLILNVVIAGLDPAIHPSDLSLLMDARVKPAHDDSKI